MAAGVDPASLHPFHRLLAATHLKDESGRTTIPIQVEQHSVRRSTQGKLPRRAGASSISGGRSAEGPQAAPSAPGGSDLSRRYPGRTALGPAVQRRPNSLVERAPARSPVAGTELWPEVVAPQRDHEPQSVHGPGSGRHSGPALRPPEIWPARPAGRPGESGAGTHQ